MASSWRIDQGWRAEADLRGRVLATGSLLALAAAFATGLGACRAYNPFGLARYKDEMVRVEELRDAAAAHRGDHEAAQSYASVVRYRLAEPDFRRILVSEGFVRDAVDRLHEAEVAHPDHRRGLLDEEAALLEAAGYSEQSRRVYAQLLDEKEVTPPERVDAELAKMAARYSPTGEPITLDVHEKKAVPLRVERGFCYGIRYRIEAKSPRGIELGVRLPDDVSREVEASESADDRGFYLAGCAVQSGEGAIVIAHDSLLEQSGRVPEPTARARVQLLRRQADAAELRALDRETREIKKKEAEKENAEACIRCVEEYKSCLGGFRMHNMTCPTAFAKCSEEVESKYPFGCMNLLHDSQTRRYLGI